MAPATMSHARVRRARKGPAFSALLLLAAAAEADVTVEVWNDQIAVDADNAADRPAQ